MQTLYVSSWPQVPGGRDPRGGVLPSQDGCLRAAEGGLLPVSAGPLSCRPTGTAAAEGDTGGDQCQRSDTVSLNKDND